MRTPSRLISPLPSRIILEMAQAEAEPASPEVELRACSVAADSDLSVAPGCQDY